MESKDVKNSLDKAVVVEGKGNGIITGYIKGWVEVELADQTMTKVRAKDLTLLPEQDLEPLAVEDVGEIEDFDPEDFGPVDKDIGEAFDVTCPGCSNTWATVKHENYRCKACGLMFHIRLHPNKENYVIGLDVTASGRDTMDINDDIASILRGKSIEDVYEKVAEEIMRMPMKTWFSKANKKAFGEWNLTKDSDMLALLDATEVLVMFLFDKFGHLNPGMQRMNLGNLLRGANKRYEENVAKGIEKRLAEA